MKISGREFLQTLNNFFNKTDPQTETFLLLILPALIFTLVLITYKGKAAKNSDPYSSLSKKDLETIEHIRLQKGLEEFDRDFIINIAFEFSLKPTRLLLDQSAFAIIEERLTDKLKKNGENPTQNKSLNYLKTIRKKLFP